MSDIGSVAFAREIADAKLISPAGGAIVFVAGGMLIACDRPDDITEQDNAWLDDVLDGYGVTELPPPCHIDEGELAGWRYWTLELRDHA
ncbi:hypothetical protein [Actinomadura spongiicola]|uniref:hypothetical protein n=1 Tax=Actinomadura spongiicola TaxID=2303421 RepID=UPI0011C17819|nr:hypothetical protein [Actinomadura spongiicola]